MKRIFIEIVDMDFSQICSSPGKFTHFQEIVTFPEAVQVLKKILRKIFLSRNCHHKVCSQFQGKMAVTDSAEDYQRLANLTNNKIRVINNKTENPSKDALGKTDKRLDWNRV